MNNSFSRNFVVGSVFLLVIVAPVLGFILASVFTSQTEEATLHPEPRSNEQLLTGVEQGLKEFDMQSSGDMSLVSSKRFNDLWYLVIIKQKDGGNSASNEETSPAIVGDFRNNPDKLTLVVPPGGSLQYPDISESMGIPYELITRFNSVKEDK
mgnify:CR=1 FL=1